MNWKRNIFLVLFLIAFSVIIPFETVAQCAMCKAVAENAQGDSGYGLANGLNSGILFIMTIPYILLATLFLVFFRKQLGSFWKSFNQIH